MRNYDEIAARIARDRTPILSMKRAREVVMNEWPEYPDYAEVDRVAWRLLDPSVHKEEHSKLHGFEKHRLLPLCEEEGSQHLTKIDRILHCMALDGYADEAWGQQEEGHYYAFLFRGNLTLRDSYLDGYELNDIERDWLSSETNAGCTIDNFHGFVHVGYWSPTATEAMEYNWREIVSRESSKIPPPDVCPTTVEEVMQALFRGEFRFSKEHPPFGSEVEKTFAKERGLVVWDDPSNPFHATLFPDRGKYEVVVVARSIEERYRAEYGEDFPRGEMFPIWYFSLEAGEMDEEDGRD